MAITESDILFKYSTKLGSAGNQNIQTDPAASLGKYISKTEWLGNSLHDLFDVITGYENAATIKDYRCFFIHNNHGSLTFQNVVVWISNEVPDGATFSIGLDPTGASGISSASPQALQSTTETTAPVGVTFTNPITEATGLAIGNLLPGTCRAIWVQRKPHDTPAINNDGGTLSFSGDTSA